MATRTDWPDDGIVLYDGVCVLCSGWIRFVSERDTAGTFRFTPISTPYGSVLAGTLGIDPSDPDTNAVVLGGRAYLRSDAAIAVLSALPGWRWTRVLKAVPSPIRDGFYSLVARNRYRIFGKRQSCDLGDGTLAAKVITKLPDRRQVAT
jgi:predicted DCC family thiol-disulfide oxidoreductase YuxK